MRNNGSTVAISLKKPLKHSPEVKSLPTSLNQREELESPLFYKEGPGEIKTPGQHAQARKDFLPFSVKLNFSSQKVAHFATFRTTPSDKVIKAPYAADQ